MSDEVCCDEIRQCLVDELSCKIANIGCEINKREKVGRDMNDLWKSSIKLLNIQWVINNTYCCFTCEEIEDVRCIVKKIKSC
jgi:hypothetical protein